MKTASPRSPRAAVLRSAPSATPLATPLPEPPKVISLRGQFMADLAAIFAGKVSAPADLYEPVSHVDMDGIIRVGVVSNMMTRELFSLAQNLKEQTAHIPFPRNPEQVHGNDRQKEELKELTEIATKLAWVGVYNEFPGDARRSSMALSAGWIVVRQPDTEDELRRQARAMCLSPEEAGLFVSEQLKRHHAEGQKVTFDEMMGNGKHSNSSGNSSETVTLGELLQNYLH